MDLADLYYVARRLHSWLEARVVPVEAVCSIPLYERAVYRDIVESPGASVLEISTRLGLSQSMVSKAVRHGVDQGWIQAASDPKDKRRTLLTPSETLGDQLAVPLAESASSVFTSLFGPKLSETDRQCIEHAFQVLHHRLKELE
ncbi:MarR family winged helix-turn-helix transcriptional regulator [Sulfoacidibacillus thermotolerans]|uniref:HTH marR-type domain-containing protein n=1 Tax=Sulfoacidibacillus thermotolerans TaxID=1765684 RepID=A0A2U3D683_SULT2|nr:MarR family transcriptional regulator [Sulfoacidibacillus thermotolerans]PWI56782.1 hypothetical protein BM613_11920 [Sulfoacidibacillus thermotolerans]